MENLVQGGVLSYEVFTFDLPNLQFYFGADERLGRILELLSDDALARNRSKMTRDDETLFEDFLILPMESRSSYGFAVETILANGEPLERSANREVLLDSGNSLMAFPRSFYSQLERVFNLTGKCRLEQEDNQQFSQLLCSKAVFDEPFDIEFVLPSTGRVASGD